MLRNSSIVRGFRYLGIDPVIGFGIVAIVIGVAVIAFYLLLAWKRQPQEDEAEASEAEQKEAEQKEAKRKKAKQRKAQRKEAKKEKARQKKAKRKEAQPKKAKRKKAQPKKAKRKDAKQKKAEQKEPEDKKRAEPPADKRYEIITDRIKRIQKKHKSILFAAANPASLPVTIPVNVAIQLAEANKRCLLIDLDLRRDAIAKAFEVGAEHSENGLQMKAFKTGLENLWVLPAHSFTKLKQMNIKPIVTKAREKFDLILINAPYLAQSIDRKQIASAAQAALIFTESAADATNLAKLIKSSNCALIANIQTPKKQAS